VTGAEPTIMLTGPAVAARKALARAGLTTADIDLYEVNEAFAAVPLRFIRDLDLNPDAVNVNGGAIAMGHPLGATVPCFSARSWMSWSDGAAAMAWPPCVSAAEWASRPSSKGLAQ
jgi:hypothetical protein